MDWSPPPRKWDGRDSVWRHDFRTGWSYCVTVPSWVILPKSRGSDPAVFYRVQVGVQSPEGITTTQGILRRFSDFLNLYFDLKKAFPKKTLPPPPPKGLLRMSSRILLEERRCSLDDWMEKLLSDIDLSRSAPAAIFLELEAAARSSFYNSIQNASDVNSSLSVVVQSYPVQPGSDMSLVPGTSSFPSDNGNDATFEASEFGTPGNGRDNYSEFGMGNIATDHDLDSLMEAAAKVGSSANYDSLLSEGLPHMNLKRSVNHEILPKRDGSNMDREKVNGSTPKVVSHDKDEMEHFSGVENLKLASHVQRSSMESLGSDVSSTRTSETSNLGLANSLGDNSFNLTEGVETSKTMDVLAFPDLQFPSDLLVALPSDEQHKVNKVFATSQQRLVTAKADMEDLITRLNQGLAVNQYLKMKIVFQVKDLEVEVENVKESSKENVQQAILDEKERFTQMQWDVDELRQKCLEMELKLKSEQDEKSHVESTKTSIIHENEMLREELNVAREQLDNLERHCEELDLKSKADVKLLTKEAKSLQNSHTELKQKLGRLAKEKLELGKEKQRWEHTNAASEKLLHEYEVLRSQLEECSVNFFFEEENKLILDTSSPSNSIDVLATSDNRIGLLLAEAQLLAQDIKNTVVAARHDGSGDSRTAYDELRKMLTSIFIDNARLRKQINSAIRCTLKTLATSAQNWEEEPL